ncbi:hypothetical protein FISHEDRAFT_71002 [Fistulina hepatica ATCC 64428]|uniref:HIT domain-containing protein n=1 Tax=Fistulina hepatica ATCC 64428 TaxID=1128425 RepID=A0A0D7AI03_9AGAR|nr:hypothetical protein FISHEDRAFT_71002 [Fistulina hepatica ATCC 64428]
MEFAPKLGCPMCGIVSSASLDASQDYPLFQTNAARPQVEVLWKDENFTAYREKMNPISSRGHIIIAFNLHVPSIYTLSSTDLPLLVNMRNLATRLLNALMTLNSPSSPSGGPSSTGIAPLQNNQQFRIGFITPPFKDNKIPVMDHLHAHAYIAPADLMGWWRGIAFGPIAWYAIDDLIAEIRESVSNNRVKSGYPNRGKAPIDTVPDAGARSGTADGRETVANPMAHSSFSAEPDPPNSATNFRSGSDILGIRV